jgi:hypothetical protein
LRPRSGHRSRPASSKASSLQVPTWIIGPALGSGPRMERPADVLKVWPQREPMHDLDRFKRPITIFTAIRPAMRCWRRWGQCIAEQLHRAGDLAARYDSEEFVVVLPGIDSVGARRQWPRLPLQAWPDPAAERQMIGRTILRASAGSLPTRDLVHTVYMGMSKCPSVCACCCGALIASRLS